MVKSKLSQKIGLISSFVLLALIVALNIYMARRSNFFNEYLINEKLTSNIKSLNNQLEHWVGSSTMAAVSMSEHPVAIRAIEERDTAGLLRFFTSKHDLYDVNYYTITDHEGVVLARTHEPERFGDSIAQQQNIIEAQKGKVSSNYEPGVIVKASTRTGAPVYNTDGNLVGVIIAGFRFDTDELVDEVKSILGAEVTVYLGEECIATTLLNEGKRATDTTLDPYIANILIGNREEYIGEKKHHGVTYSTYYKPLLNSKGETFAIISIGISISEIKSERINMIFGIVLITFMVFLLAAVLLVNLLRVFRNEQLNNLQLVKLDLMIKGSKIGLWDMNIVKSDPVNPANTFIWSDEFRKMLGFEDETDFPNILSSWSDRLHPEDKEVTLDAFAKHMTDTTGNTPYNVEYRLLKKDGEYEYFHATGETIRDQKGQPIHVAGALRNINERKMLEINLQTASKAKSDFLATMSHEIRTPMNAILGITEIQLQDDSLDDKVAEALYKIYTSGDMLMAIINDILDLSKIESGKLELLIANYEIASLLSDTAQLNMMRIGSKPIEFFLDVDENLPILLSGDELRIKQVLNNVLSNAFKYTDEGTVRMSVSAEAGKNENDVILVFSVSDTGQGMSAEQVEKLFDEYSRFNAEANRTTEGTGLGMSITRNLIHMMNGKIDIESEPGEGSTFTVRIPQTKVSSDVLGKEMADNLHNFRTGSRAQMQRTQITRDPMPYGHILVVDDVDTNIFVAKGLLAPYKLKIDSANSGFMAIEKIKEGNVYDIIFMDHMMPMMDGVETTKNIREMGYEHPIVALTANAVVGQADTFLNNGFDDFISKPIDVRKLNVILNKLVRDKQPIEVIEEAKRMAESLGQKSDVNTIKQSDTKFANFEIPGLDINKGLKRYGSEEVYLDILRSFTTNTLKLLESTKDVSEDTLAEYTVSVHGIKGSGYGIFAEEVADAAKKLEDASNDGDFEYVKNFNQPFQNMAFELVNKLENMIATIDKELGSQKMVKDKPETELLSRLSDACEAFDMEAVVEVMKEIDIFQYNADDGLVAWLRENVDLMNYMEIVEKLSEVQGG